MVLDVRACLKGTNLATFEQPLIKISINFTLQYGVPLIDSADWLTQHCDHNNAAGNRMAGK